MTMLTATGITAEQIGGILSNITGTISVTAILEILAIGLGAGVSFVFMWWGVRKLISMFMSGFRKGRASA